MNDYRKYRGKCKELAEAAVKTNPDLTLVRGYYHDFLWGKQPHWWTKDKDKNIHDPSKDQFPSKGLGEYEEFDGMVECANCGKQMKEEKARFDSRYAFCSIECNMRFVGL